MTRLRCYIVVVLCCPAIVCADVAQNKKHEIDYLLRFVRDSACHIDIHGDNLTGVYASAHIQQQYQLHIRDILSAEDFISSAASRSRIAGKYSMVACPHKPAVRTIDWLQRALNVYRLKRRF